MHTTVVINIFIIIHLKLSDSGRPQLRSINFLLLTYHCPIVVILSEYFLFLEICFLSN